MEDNNKKTLSRREAIKMLGTVAGGAIPAVWAAPIVDKSVLPVHAQTSEISLVDGQLSAFGTAQSGTGAGSVGTNDILEATFTSNPPKSGVKVIGRMILIQPGHPRDGQAIHTVEGTTNSEGKFTISKELYTVGGLLPGGNRIVIHWSYVDPDLGREYSIEQGVGVSE